MTPVYQTLFGNKQGNCYAASIASLFEIPLEEVPNFCWDKNWPNNRDEWLKERGFACISFEVTKESYSTWLFDLTNRFKNVMHLAAVESPRGPWLHSVVFQNGKLIHDPHPDGGSQDAIPVEFDFFISINPAEVLRAFNVANALAKKIGDALNELTASTSPNPS